MLRPAVGDEEALVDLPFAVHPLADLRLAHECGEAVLQHAGPNAAEHVVAAVLLENHGVDALQMEQLGQQQSRRAPADDSDLSPHRLVSPNTVRNRNCYS